MAAVCMIQHSGFPQNSRVRSQALALARAGHRVHVICVTAPGDPADDECAGVKVTRVPVSRDRLRGKLGYLAEYASFFRHAHRTLARLEAQERFDVVEVHNVPEELVFAAGPARRHGAAILLDIHDPMPELYADKFGLGPDSAVKKVLLRLESASCRRADHILVAADPFKERFVRLGVPEHRMTVILNSPEPSLLPSPQPPFIVLFHGSVFERYGLDTVIEGIALAACSIPGLELHLYASDVDGRTLAALKRRAAELGIGERVAFNGYVAPIALRRIIADADVGVCALRRSTHIDLTYPTKLFEYLAHGLPVLAARTPAIVGGFGQAGIEYYEPGDARSFAAALENVARARRARPEADPRPCMLREGMSWPAMERRLLRVIDELAADKTRVRRAGVGIVGESADAGGGCPGERDGALSSRRPDFIGMRHV